MSSSSTLSLDHLTSSEHLCYVRCNVCATVLVVSVPSTSLFKAVTVRCGHCSNHLPVNIPWLLLPSPNQQVHPGHGFFSGSHNFLQEQIHEGPNFVMNPNSSTEFNIPVQTGIDNLPRPPLINRPPEKRQRIPSAYNRFIKEEIQRIKAINPDINHREAFSAAAKNWAHFPHIQFGLKPDITAKRTAFQQEEEGGLMKSGLFATPNLGVSPR